MNLDYKLFYLLFAENSDAGDPGTLQAAAASGTFFPSNPRAR